MKHYHVIACPFCDSEDLVKHGHNSSGVQRWCCNRCKRSFQPEYKYNAWKPGIKETIIEQTLNSSGVRDTGRNLKINKNTVITVLKKTLKTNPYFSQSGEKLEVAVKLSGELDEFWSFVQNKSNQRWTRYAIERKSGCILAWHNGKRSDRDFLILWEMLKAFNVDCYYTDNWGAYSKYILPERHRIGKYNTWKIERKKSEFQDASETVKQKNLLFFKELNRTRQRYRNVYRSILLQNRNL